MTKQFISNIIQDEFKTWGNAEKLFLIAPTGKGKTSFIVSSYLPYHASLNHKVLILCNRKLLRRQYWYDLVMKYTTMHEIDDVVDLMTYQELAEKIRCSSNYTNLFHEYYSIICDEAHYFYSDDFNGFGTYAVLQAIVDAGIFKQIIFTSATFDEVKPLIENTINSCFIGEGHTDSCKKITTLDYSFLENYDYVTCYSVPDFETLSYSIVKTEGKSIIFIDNIDTCNQIKTTLIEKHKLKPSEVEILRSSSLDESSPSATVEALTMSHRLLPKVLLTTSVLDNGVSICDPEVKNVAIITDSKISFLQMLGRIRAHNGSKINLFFVVRDATVFKKRENETKYMFDIYKKMKTGAISWNHVISELFNNPDSNLSKIYRHFSVHMPRMLDYFGTIPSSRFRIHDMHYIFTLNQFAGEKISSLLISYAKYYYLAVTSPQQVIYEQASWIDKTPQEVTEIKSTYLESLKGDMIDELISVIDYSYDDLVPFKKDLVTKYSKHLFSDLPISNATLSKEKFDELLERYNLELITTRGDNRKNHYTIKYK